MSDGDAVGGGGLAVIRLLGGPRKRADREERHDRKEGSYSHQFNIIAD
jgi:hypothetical protein